MNFNQVEKYIDEYRDALVLDKVTPRALRGKVRGVLSVITLVLLALVAAPFIHDSLATEFMIQNVIYLRAGCYILGSLWVTTMLFEGMYMSYYFKAGKIDMEVARIIEFHEEDMIKGFLLSVLGQRTMRRLGITQGDIDYFLENRKMSLPKHAIEIDDEGCHEGHIDVVRLALSFAHHDKEFSFFLFERGVGEALYEGALRMVATNRRILMERERWLTRDHLATFPSIGRRWSYGQTYYLDLYAGEIEPGAFRVGENTLYHDDVAAVEKSLLKVREPHVTFISPDPLHGLEVMKLLVRRIRKGKTPSYLEDKRLFLVNGVLLVESLQENFEQEFMKLIAEASHTGNSILVFEHAAEFVNILHTRGIELSVLLEPAFLSHTHIILLTDSDGYHETLQTDSLIRNYTDHIMAAPQSDEAILRRLQRDVAFIERKTGLTFTYQALHLLLKEVKRHTGNEAVTDSTLDVLHEVLPLAKHTRHHMITRHEMQEAIDQHFGVPEVLQESNEKNTLLHLEDILSEYVVGQDLALKAIADTLRRVRAGLRREGRPLGSFFLVGPTGVGKTETAKTLARVYFGNEEYLTRLDMSEYNTEASVRQLLGSSQEPGRLASMLKDQPYGVLLLDEFEKAHPDVHNLFLQILDEGKATDGRGGVINAQQLIIIATSNAGSELLTTEDFQDLGYEERQKVLLRYIASRRILPIELINRFDHSILFQALENDTVKEVARMQLEQLKTKMREKGMNLKITPFAISYLVHKGVSAEFGAREVQRVIADTLESELAKSILRGDVPQGATISFGPSEKGEEFEVVVE